MDPISNPTPTSNPMPTPTPAPDPVPEPTVVPEPVVSEPVVPEPVVPEPVSNPTPPPVVPSPVMTPPPVNPVINPTGAPANSPAFQADVTGIAATDPIMTPEPAKAPDPIEEELKAPMKAAGPVPGSIGSAVSGPADGNVGASMPSGGNPFDNMPKERAQSVPFNDPAVDPTVGAQGSIGSGSGKKPQSKKTLIALIVIAAIIVVGLVAVLAMQLLGNGNSGSSGGNTPTPVVDDDTPSTSMNTLTCTRKMTNEEMLSAGKNVVSGTVAITVNFDVDNLLQSVSLTKSVVYSNTEENVNNETTNGEETNEETITEEEVVIEEKETDVADLTSENAGVYYLVDSNKKVLNDLDSIQANYVKLAFTCE